MKRELPPGGFMPLCNMQLVDSQTVRWRLWWCWLICGVGALFVTNIGLKSYSTGQRKLWELVVLVMKYRRQIVKWRW